jgi:DNA (cytosine-5)-methyltransferase 1
LKPKKNKCKFDLISLFAGAGGLEFAACSTASINKIVSTDANEVFLKTTCSNLKCHFPEVEHICFTEDVRQVSGDRLIKKLGNPPDVLIGGPPCDDFTGFGLRKGIEGRKGPLIFEFLRLVQETNPICFIFENVPNLTQQFRSVFDDFLAYSEDIGYKCYWDLLHACDFGAPTIRKRVFVVGWRKSINGFSFRFPEATHSKLGEVEKTKPFTMISNVLDTLPDVKTNEATKFDNHTGRPHKPVTIEHMKTVPPGKYVPQSRRYRAPWNALCRSLTAGLDNSTKSYLHPVFHREMSVREYARIHGFPDTWIFNGTHHNGIKQVANAVPLPLGSAVLSKVFDTISKIK